mgnify:CR=1 FL=1
MDRQPRHHSWCPVHHVFDFYCCERVLTMKLARKSPHALSKKCWCAPRIMRP